MSILLLCNLPSLRGEFGPCVILVGEGGRGLIMPSLAHTLRQFWILCSHESLASQWNPLPALKWRPSHWFIICISLISFVKYMNTHATHIWLNSLKYNDDKSSQKNTLLFSTTCFGLKGHHEAETRKKYVCVYVYVSVHTHAVYMRLRFFYSCVQPYDDLSGRNI